MSHSQAESAEQLRFATLPPASAFSPRTPDARSRAPEFEEEERIGAMLGVYPRSSIIRRLDLPQSHPRLRPPPLPRSPKVVVRDGDE
ncbi:MAG: hypothetical protein ACPGUV_06045 [Polyangiales bacterium]